EGPGGGQLHPLTGSIEQSRPDLFLQQPDLPGERRLGDVEVIRSPAEVPGGGNGEEILELASFDHGVLWVAGEYTSDGSPGGINVGSASGDSSTEGGN